jgi:hypothetical protein
MGERQMFPLQTIAIRYVGPSGLGSVTGASFQAPRRSFRGPDLPMVPA